MYKYILTKSFWLLIGNLIGRMSLFLANFFAARLLDQNSFGQFMMIRHTFSMIEAVVASSIGNIVLKSISVEYKNNKNLIPLIITAYLINIFIVVVSTFFIFLFSESLVNLLFLGDKNMIEGFYFGSFLLASVLLSSISQKILIGLESYKAVAVTAVIVSTVSIPIIYELIQSFQFIGAIVGVSFYLFLDAFAKIYIISLQFKKKKIIFSIQKSITWLKSITSSSLFLILSSIIVAFTFWYIRVLIIEKANNFQDIALFDVAYQWMTIIMIITGATTSIALQMFSKNNHSNKDIFKTNLVTNILIVLIFSTIFSLFSKQLMMIFGETYLAGHTLIYILSFTALFATISSLTNKLLISHEKYKIIFRNTIIASLGIILFVKLVTLSDLALELSIALTLYYLLLMLLDILSIKISIKMD